MTSDAVLIKDIYRNWNNNCDQWLKFGWIEYRRKGYILYMEKCSKIVEMCTLENERFVL